MTAENKRTVLEGSPIIPGIGIGTAYYHRDLMSREFEVHELASHEIEPEIERVADALQMVKCELDELSSTVREQIDPAHAEIFEAQKMMLDGMNIPQTFAETIREQQISSEYIIRGIFRNWENRFLEGKGEVLQERAKDIADLGSRLLKHLLRTETQPLAGLDQPSIIFARRLLPSDTVIMDAEHVAGIVTTEGGRNSHAAILARALDIPMVSNLVWSVVMEDGSSTAIVDGEKGVVLVHPEEQDLEAYRTQSRENRLKAEARMRKVQHAKLVLDDREIRIKASATNARQVEKAMAAGAEGIGLFRTEALYMQHNKMPDEDWLHEHLEACCAAARGTPFTIRLLDIGADKELPYLPLAQEANPALGIRGIRYLLRHESLLRAQLRVCLRLSRKYVIRILIPMVSIVEDVAAVKRMLKEESEKTGIPAGGIAVGAMIETPAAVLCLDELLREVRFINIGTNHLIQYAMAVDRDSIELEHYYAHGERLVLDWIFHTARKARESGVECKICGNLAKNLDRLGDLVSGGVEMFCVVPSFIPVLKEALHEFLSRECRISVQS